MCDKNRKRNKKCFFFIVVFFFQHNGKSAFASVSFVRGYANSKSNKILSKLPFFVFVFCFCRRRRLFFSVTATFHRNVSFEFFSLVLHVFVCRLMRQLTFNTCVTLAAPMQDCLCRALTRFAPHKGTIKYVSFLIFLEWHEQICWYWWDVRRMWANWMEWMHVCVRVFFFSLSSASALTSMLRRLGMEHV